MKENSPGREKTVIQFPSTASCHKNKWGKTGADMSSTLPICHRRCNFVSITFIKKYWVEEEPGIKFSRLSDFSLISSICSFGKATI